MGRRSNYDNRGDSWHAVWRTLYFMLRLAEMIFTHDMGMMAPTLHNAGFQDGANQQVRSLEHSCAIACCGQTPCLPVIMWKQHH